MEPKSQVTWHNYQLDRWDASCITFLCACGIFGARKLRLNNTVNLSPIHTYIV